MPTTTWYNNNKTMQIVFVHDGDYSGSVGIVKTAEGFDDSEPLWIPFEALVHIVGESVKNRLVDELEQMSSVDLLNCFSFGRS